MLFLHYPLLATVASVLSVALAAPASPDAVPPACSTVYTPGKPCDDRNRLNANVDDESDKYKVSPYDYQEYEYDSSGDCVSQRAMFLSSLYS